MGVGRLSDAGAHLQELHALWCEPDRGDEYIGTLVNNTCVAVAALAASAPGERYFDVGTVRAIARQSTPARALSYTRLTAGSTSFE